MKKEYCSGEGSYILNYRRIKGADGNTDHLLIKYADGREEIEVYSIEREREILSIQKEQLKTVASKTEEDSKRRSKST